MRLRTATIAVTTATLLAAGIAPAARADTAKCTPSWQLVGTPSVPTGTVLAPLPQTGASDVSQSTGASLLSVSAVSGKSVWFAGGYATTLTGFGAPWLLHGDGSSVGSANGQPVPPPRTAFATAGRASFDSDTDGWSLSSLPSAATTPFAQRWHGGQWTSVPLAPSTDAARYNVRISDVAAIAPDDAWAVGSSYAVDTLLGTWPVGAVVQHWDGDAWTIVPNPLADEEYAGLDALAVVSPDDVWAVGEAWSHDERALAPVVEHWDGKAWSTVSPPAGGPLVLARLDSVSATRGGVWASGVTQDHPGAQGGVPQPVVEHFDGTAWHVAGGLPDLGGGRITAVYAAADDDVWATALNPRTNESAFLHWTGKAWTSTPVPGPKEYGLTYRYGALDGTGPGDVWAAGYVDNRANGLESPQIAHLRCHSGRA